MKTRAGISLDFLKHWHSRQLPELSRLGRLSVNHPHRNDPSAFHFRELDQTSLSGFQSTKDSWLRHWL